MKDLAQFHFDKLDLESSIKFQIEAFKTKHEIESASTTILVGEVDVTDSASQDRVLLTNYVQINFTIKL